MKLIIDIADDQYKAVQDGMWCGSLYEELKNGIPVEQSGDLISREEMWKAYHKMIDRENTIYVFNAIKNLPSVTPQPKMGRWIMSDDGLYRPICNNCGAHPWKGYIPTVEEATEVFKYCPNCGAKMPEVEG